MSLEYLEHSNARLRRNQSGDYGDNPLVDGLAIDNVSGMYIC
jgi:hypothetical protein